MADPSAPLSPEQLRHHCTTFKEYDVYCETASDDECIFCLAYRRWAADATACARLLNALNHNPLSDPGDCPCLYCSEIRLKAEVASLRSERAALIAERDALYTALFEIREACCSGMGHLPQADIERGQLALEKVDEGKRMRR